MGSGKETWLFHPRTPISAEDVLESLTDVFAALDAGWRFTYLNAAAERLLRRSRAELLGREVWAEYPVLKGTPVELETRRALAEGVPASFEHGFDGRFFEFRAFPARTDGLHVYVREITDQKRVAAELQGSREEAERRLAELENIYRTAPIGMLLVDTDLRYVRINERLAAINGLPAAEHIGRTIREMVPEIADAVTPNYLKVIATGEPIIDEEVTGSTPADRHVEHNYLCSYYPVKDLQGKVVGVTAIVRDITDQKRAEDALRESEGRFRGVYESNIVGINFAAMDGTNIDANDEFLRITGYTREDLTAGWVNWASMTLPEHAERDREAIEEALRTGRVRPYRKELIRKDGTRVPVMVGGAALPGQLIGAGFVVDLTELQAAAQALRESEERYRSLAAATSAVVWTADKDGKVTHPMPSWERFTGQKWPEYRDWGAGRLIHPEDRERAAAAWNRAVRTRSNFKVQYRVWHARTSEYRYVVNRGVPVLNSDGSQREWVGTLTDIHERKRAEEALRESEHRYSTLAEAMPAIVWSSNPKGQIIYTNSQWTAYTGQPPEEAAGSGWTKHLHPDDVPRSQAGWRESRAAGRPFEVEYRIRGREANYRWFLARALPVRDAEGRIDRWLGACMDIDDRKRAEEDLRLAAQRFAVALKNSSIAVFNQDRDLRYTWLWNEHPTHYHKAILGKTDLEIKKCEACERLTEVKRRVLETGAGERLEIILPLFGEECVYVIMLEPLRDEGGEVIGITGAAINITERKRTEEALAASEERFRRIVETAAEGIMIQDAEGRITLANRRLAELLGYRLEELVGRLSFDFLHEDDVDRGRRSFQSRKTGDSATRDFRFRRREGTTVWFSIAGSTLRGDRGEFLGVLGMVTDITERKHAEMALREKEIHMRLALDAGCMGTWDLDLVAGAMHWSDRHFTAFGLEPGCFKPDAARFLACVHPDDREAVARELERSRLEHRLYGAEYRVVWPDQSIHWIEARGQYSYDAEGKAVRMRGVVADVTDRKQTEEAMRHRQKLEGVGLLAGGIAHDFNNLLAGILGGASYALDLLPEAHPAIPMLKVVEQASERAALLTRQLLAYSGRGQFVLDKLDLGMLVRETCELIRASVPKSVAVVIHGTPDLPPIVGDPGQMQQLIMNLLINAGEAIGDGNHGVVTIRTGCEEVDAERIQAHFRPYDIPQGRYVVLEVADNGAGMDQATLSRIFDPFFTTKFTGRGLGLAAAQGIVRGHHGALEVESTLGSGTTFRVLLPVADAAPAAPVEPVGDPQVRHGAVLLVDDEDMVRRTVASSLERDGFTVWQASSGVDAIRIFSERAPEIALVVLDMSMPGMGGAEVLRELRVWRPEFPVLVYSGFSEGEISREFRGLAISGVLQKPFSARELTRRVQQILASS